METIGVIEDSSIEWLDGPKTINAELKIDGVWYQGFLDIVELDEED
tara:strand:+ start:412 stop:549 length:138 start_codon:yes stop_codon:yes gene_type:complete